MAQLERALRPLSRKLAVRLARRRDVVVPVRLTFATRASQLSTGRTDRLRFKPPTRPSPRSSSSPTSRDRLASFARFTLHLVHAISCSFSQGAAACVRRRPRRGDPTLRGMDDRPRRSRGSTPRPTSSPSTATPITGARCLSFTTLRQGVTRRSTILILGDARNNYHSPRRSDRRPQIRAKAVYWLNPSRRPTGTAGTRS